MSSLLKYEVVVFDFDGTLIDSMSDFSEVASSIMAQIYNCDKTWAQERYHQTSGNPFRKQLDEIFPKDQRNQEVNLEFIRKKKEVYQKRIIDSQVIRVLKWIKSQGCKLVISSNSEEEILLEKTKEIAFYFDCILGFSPGFEKGDGHFSWIQNEYNLKKNAMVFIGDSLHDAKISKKFGIDFIAKLGTFTTRDFINQGFDHIAIEGIEQLKQRLMVSPVPQFGKQTSLVKTHTVLNSNHPVFIRWD